MKLLSFEKQFGKGIDPWYKKIGRWVKKKFKNPYLRHLALGFIEWLKQKWIGVKIENTMQDVDAQIKEIKEVWDEDCLLYTSPSPRDRQKSRMPSSA